ncbi:MAG: Unknown protein [uncultured Sulfurovum sp.]|uniref:Uncharacterized protein n=1 Tax=uncultured Sulfurovum sp. TaxID=269237 RepID=A0A6S6TTD7_9BACT|nr:MAG: Unknown protein [uncultured Sulfurovum sp.]
MIGLDVEAFLGLSELEELEALELCDTLWLAKYMKTDNQYYVEEENKKEIEKPKSTSTEQKDNVKDSQKQTPSKKTNIDIEEDENVALSLGNIETTKQKSFYVPHKGYFDNTTQLSSYLRGFKEKVDSRHKTLFNEEKTVDYIASTKISTVFLEAKKEKKYELYLVIDSSDSMVLWREMVDSYANLLVNSGVFRSVKRVYIDTKSEETIFYNRHLAKLKTC